MLYCGFDIGTTNTKAILLDREGNLLLRTCLSTEKSTNRNGFSAETWLNQMYRILEQFTGNLPWGENEIACSIASQGGSFVPLDRDFEPAGRVISWMESAAAETVESLVETFDVLPFYTLSGWQPKGWLMIAKVRELLQKRLEKAHSDISFVATPVEYLHRKMGLRFATDITNSQITGMLDFRSASLHPKLLEWAGLNEKMLPDIITQTEAIGDIKYGKGVTLKWTTSVHDQYAAMRALDLAVDSDAMLATGTAWVLNGRSAAPVFDKETFLVHPGRDLRDGAFGYIVTFGPIGAGFEKLLTRCNITFEQLKDYETSCKTVPMPNAPVQADILTGQVDSADDPWTALCWYKAATAARITYILEKSIRNHFREKQKIVMTGGAARNRLWPQIIADISQIPVKAVTFDELTAYGAAMFARDAVDKKDSATLKIPGTLHEVYEPNPDSPYYHWYKTWQLPMLKNTGIV